MASGKIKFFNPQKGFGFISQDGASGKDIFVHVSQVQGDPDSLREGTSVEFDVVQGKKGPEANNVRIK